MGYRRFVDRDGNSWEIRDESRSTWRFAPVGANTQSSVSVQPPGYENDPFELSDQELQRLLNANASPSRRTSPPSPFKD